MTTKNTKNVPAVTHAADLAGKAWARIEKAAAEVHAERAEKPTRSLQLVSSGAGFSAIIKSGNVTVQLEGDAFAVSTSD